MRRIFRDVNREVYISGYWIYQYKGIQITTRMGKVRNGCSTTEFTEARPSRRVAYWSSFFYFILTIAIRSSILCLKNFAFRYWHCIFLSRQLIARAYKCSKIIPGFVEYDIKGILNVFVINERFLLLHIQDMHVHTRDRHTFRVRELRAITFR